MNNICSFLCTMITPLVLPRLLLLYHSCCCKSHSLSDLLVWQRNEKKNFEIDSSQLLQSINNGCHCVAVVDMELMIGHEKNVLVKDAGRRMGWIYCKLLWVVDTTTNVILEPLRLTQDQITIAVRYYFTIYLPYPAPCRPSFALQEGVLCVSVCGNID